MYTSSLEHSTFFILKNAIFEKYFPSAPTQVDLAVHGLNSLNPVPILHILSRVPIEDIIICQISSSHGLYFSIFVMKRSVSEWYLNFIHIDE